MSLSSSCTACADIDGHELFVSISVGIALSMPEHSATEELLRDADTAMYRAKSLGTGRTEIFDRKHFEG